MFINLTSGFTSWKIEGMVVCKRCLQTISHFLSDTVVVCELLFRTSTLRLVFFLKGSVSTVRKSQSSNSVRQCQSGTGWHKNTWKSTAQNGFSNIQIKKLKKFNRKFGGTQCSVDINWWKYHENRLSVTTGDPNPKTNFNHHTRSLHSHQPDPTDSL